MRRLVLASLFGALAVLAALVLAFLALAAVLAHSGKQRLAVPAGAVLVLDLSRPVADAPAGRDLVGHALERTLGVGVGPARLDELVRALDHAATDRRVEALLITGQIVQDGLHSSWPALTELRAALARLRAAGKPVVAHPYFWGKPELYLGSVASEAWIDPLGSLRIDGFAYERLHFARGLEELGIEVQMGRVGRFKSAVEPFVQGDMSDEARGQLEELLAAQARVFHGTIAADRPVEPAQLLELERQAPILNAQTALARGLVDRAVAVGAVDGELARLCGKAEDWVPERMQLADYAAAVLPASSTRSGRIAVLFAEGTIQSGQGQRDVHGDVLAELVDEVRRDAGVSAVVLRINSPGGSVEGSERIRRALEELAAEKPLVISMGALAASGGYWIACAGHEILAHPNTLTGSIGIFYLLPNAARLAERVGLDVHRVQSSDQAAARSFFAHKTPEQLAVVQEHIEHLYEAFLARVAGARGLTREAVGELAEGRVWTGERALELGLIDRLGHLDDALAAAARRAGLKGTPSLSFPQAVEPPLLTRLIDELVLSPSHRHSNLLGSAPGGIAALLSELDSVRRVAHELLSSTDSLGATARLPYELRLR